MTRPGHCAFLTAAVLFYSVACSSPPEEPKADESKISGEASSIKKETREGPVRATIELSPSEPTLGDTLELKLSVITKEGVSVEMPDYDPALGRFDVLKHSATESISESDERVMTETYSLQATRSGRMRIPRLRVVFEDKRDGQADVPDGAQAGAQDSVAGARELLTEEIPIEVAAVLPEEARGQALPNPPGQLDASFGQTPLRRFRFLVMPILLLLGLAYVIWRRMSKRSEKAARVDPYDAAITRLEKLRSEGVPDDEGLDAWYVELSSIVRHYMEGRFALRAPELTTEEFLRETQSSSESELNLTQKTLIAELLAGCDRVKFGKYRPASEEIQGSLAIATKFIEDTKTVASPTGEAPELKAKTQTQTQPKPEAEFKPESETEVRP